MQMRNSPNSNGTFELRVAQNIIRNTNYTQILSLMHAIFNATTGCLMIDAQFALYKLPPMSVATEMHECSSDSLSMQKISQVMTMK